MAKAKKKTRVPQYEAIVENKGLKFSDKSLYGFRFQTQAEAYAFHYSLIGNKIDYIFYDGATEKVKIYLLSGIEKVRECAEKYHGVEYTPTTLDDYD